MLFLLLVCAQFHPEMGKLVYCSRTVGEIEKALEELKRLMQYREKELGTPADFTAIGLTSRRNLCLHERVRRGLRRPAPPPPPCRPRWGLTRGGATRQGMWP